MDDVTDPRRATITAVMLTYQCPVCEVTIDDQIEAEEAGRGHFAVPVEERFDLCSHCGAFLDLGAELIQGAA